MPKETFFNLPEDKQEKVVRAAISEFLAHGFEKGNIGEIAKTAGVAKGSMYQYFDNKQELFMYAVRWSTDLIMKLHDGSRLNSLHHEKDLFEVFFKSARQTWQQLREEREVVIFAQEVFGGKFKNVPPDIMDYFTKIGDESALQFIREGQRMGVIRKDIDERILTLVVSGASMRIKEYILQKAKSAGDELLDDMDLYEKETRDLLEVLINGMGVK